MRLARTTGLTGLALLGAAALTGSRLTFPADNGAWAPLALPGTVVDAMVAGEEGVLVAHDGRLRVVRPDGTLAELRVGSAVRSLAADGKKAYAGTDSGVLSVPLDGGSTSVDGLGGIEVLSLDAEDGVVLAGTDDGLHRRDLQGTWSRIWPARGPGRAVSSVLNVEDTALFVHDGSVYRLAGDGHARPTLAPRDGDVVSLSRGIDDTQVWAGARADRTLFASPDGGRTWHVRDRGLGLSAANVVAVDPHRPATVLVGGSGLADGNGNAGVQRSTDRGRHWRSGQDRLSNTEVTGLLFRPERATVEVGLPAGTGHALLPLPGDHLRVYAATSGGGVYTSRPRSAVATHLAAAQDGVRVLEPLLLGLVLALALIPTYVRLTGARQGVDVITRTHRTNHDEERE